MDVYDVFLKKNNLVFRVILFIYILYIANLSYSNENNIVYPPRCTDVALESDCQKIFSGSIVDDTKPEIITITAIVNNDLISTSIPIESLKTKYITDATDYLKNISGFSTIRQGGTNNDFIFRGISGSKMHILVNTGEMIGACLSRMDPATSYIFPETFDILNFVKGPQTVLWGPVSPSGIIQFQRYHPNFNMSDIRMRSNITIGSFNSIKRNIDTIFGGKYGYIRLVGNCDYSGNYRDANNYPVHSAWYKWNFDANLSVNLKSNTYLEINLGQGNGSANYAIKSMDGLCFSRDSYGLKIITSDINNVLNEMEFQFWNHHIHHIMRNKVVSIPIKSILLGCNQCCCNHASNTSSVDRILWGSRGMITYQWKDFTCYSGMDMQINQHKKQKDFISNLYPAAVSKDFGIFTELLFDALLDKKIIGGMRLEYSAINAFNQCGIRSKNSLLYPAGFVRYESNISSSWLYYCGIGACYRFPDYWELMSIELNKHSEKINSIFQLKPEKTVQIDIGTYFQKFNVNGWISSYVGYIKDFIYYHYNDNKNMVKKNNIIDYISNVRAQIYGAEMGLSYQFNDYWYVESNVSWPWGWNMDDKCILPTISPIESKLICRFKQKNYTIGTLLRLVSSSKYITDSSSLIFPSTLLSKKYVNADYTPGFGIMSIYVSWKAYQYYTCNIGVDNLFNRNYREYVNIINDYNISKNSSNFIVYEPGRMWWMNVGVAF